MKTKYTLPIVAALVALITILIFCAGIPSGKAAIDYVALLFVLIAEGAFFGVLYLSKQATRLTSLAAVPIISIYTVISLFISVLLKGLFSKNIFMYVIIQLILLAIAAVALLLANKLTFASSQEDKRIVIQRAVIDECEAKAHILCEDDRFTKYREKLEKIYESIKYSDHVSDVKSGEILEALDKIYHLNEGLDICAACDAVQRLINERNIIVKNTKRGGY